MLNSVVQLLRRGAVHASVRLGCVVALGWWTSAGESAAQTNYLDNDGVFQIIDPAALNESHRFYRLRYL